MRSYIVLLTFLLTSLFYVETKLISLTHDHSFVFDTYVRAFIVEADIRGLNLTKLSEGLTIELVDKIDVPSPPGQFYAGYSYCTEYSKHIQVLLSHWIKLNEPAREQLIMHELGHCLLGLQHTECPSLMCYKTLDPNDWVVNRTRYLDDALNSVVR